VSQLVQVIGTAVAYYFGGPWAAFAFNVADSVYQTNKANQKRRDAIAAYNSHLKDRLEMADVTPNAARTIVLGRVRYVEGIRRRWVSGTNSEKLTMVVSFASHEIDGFEQWYLNEIPVTLDASGWVQPTSTGTGSGYTTSATGFAIGTTSIPLISGSGTINAGDLVQFSGDATYYTVSTGISGPGTLAIASPGLQKAIPASATAVTLIKAPYSSTTRTPKSDSGTMDGSGNATLTLSGTPVSTPTVTWTTGSGDTTQQGSASVSVTGTTATITGGQPGAAFTCNYLSDVTTSYVRIRPYLGTSTQSVGADHASEYPGKLKTTDAFAGIACALIDCIYNPDVFPSGRPTVTAVMRGAKVYDPRLDSTAGGSGTQRISDPTTWTFSENPALHALYYALHANGWAVPASDINVADIFSAANTCDISTNYTLTATGGGTTTVTLPQFRCGITLPTDGDPMAAMDSIIETMAGRRGWAGGILRFRAGVMAASSFTIDETWFAQKLDAAGQPGPDPVIKGANGIQRDQRFNRITGTCIDPAQRYQMLPFPEVEDATLIAAHGERLSDIQLPGVNHIAHAQHLATVRIREAQAGLRLECTTNLYAFLVGIFDVGSMNMARFGFSGKTFEVVGWRWHPQDGITLQLAEITAALFDTSATLNGRDPAPDSTLRLPYSVESMSGVSVSSGTTPTLDGAIITRTVVSWTAAVTDYIRQGGRIEVQYTLAAAALPTGDWSSVTEAGTATLTTITGLLAGRFYLFRVRAVQPSPLVRGTWTDPVIAQVAGVPNAGVLNSNITLGSNGALSGAGGGQVTLPGMGQHSYRIYCFGYQIQLNGTATGAAGIFEDGSTSPAVGAGGYTIAVISRATGQITTSASYNVLGGGTAPADMAAYLNALDSTHIVAIWTNDEPQANRLLNGLDAAMYRCGASRAVYGSSQFQYRSAYILIGIPGGGEGNGAEFYQGSISSDPNAWCDAAFTVLNGNITGVSSTYKPRTLADYSYTGDLNATNGAPSGTPVAGTFPGSTLASTVETNANNAYNGLTAAITASLSGTYTKTVSVAGTQVIGSPAVSASGGTGTLTYSWSLVNTGNDLGNSDYLYLTGTLTGSTIGLSGVLSGTTTQMVHGTVICVVTDGNGRTVTLQHTAYLQHT
jgi:hypothetical protein